jgi:hypothetical protein
LVVGAVAQPSLDDIAALAWPGQPPPARWARAALLPGVTGAAAVGVAANPEARGIGGASLSRGNVSTEAKPSRGGGMKHTLLDVRAIWWPTDISSSLWRPASGTTRNVGTTTAWEIMGLTAWYAVHELLFLSVNSRRLLHILVAKTV